MWRIHFDIWQNQYNIVKLKNKIKFKKKMIHREKNRGIIKKKKKFPQEGRLNALGTGDSADPTLAVLSRRSPPFTSSH